MIIDGPSPIAYPPAWVAFGNRLRTVRMETSRMSLRKFAASIGHSPTEVSQVEQGDLTREDAALAMMVALDMQFSEYHLARFGP